MAKATATTPTTAPAPAPANTFTGPGTPLSSAGLKQAATPLGGDMASLWSLVTVETQGCGFLIDRRPKILFERHYFHRLTAGKYDSQDPDISQPTPGGYGPGGAHQYLRLTAALALDEDAALQSASWGLGQIMGANHAKAGYASARAMVDAFVANEDAQLAGMAAFIANSGIAGAVAQQKWADYARLYNGADYAKNTYDTRLAAAHARYVKLGCPDVDLRAAQVWLNYLGLPTGGIDGIAGQATTAALRSFQKSASLAITGKPDAPTLAALKAKFG